MGENRQIKSSRDGILHSISIFQPNFDRKYHPKMQQNILLQKQCHDNGFIFSCLKMRLFQTFWGIFTDNFKDCFLEYLKNSPCKYFKIFSTDFIFRKQIVLLTSTDFNTDECIGEFIKRIWSSGLFWAVGAAEKKNLPTAIGMQLFGVFF